MSEAAPGVLKSSVNLSAPLMPPIPLASAKRLEQLVEEKCTTDASRVLVMLGFYDEKIFEQRVPA